MTDTEINLAIAKACGLDAIVSHLIPTNVWIRESNAAGYRSCPDYANDLNAMHEAEKVLHSRNHAQMCVVYRDYLNDFMERDRAHDLAQGLGYHATAHQRAEAFLRTLNLWSE